ncbi:hypothetical protein [Haloparvum sedimenti]|uniref:hypothetical protein n=1 Tax=Haloparvum sedimenti TaxID=1678448 RepID=UPI00071E94D7|nr:hypothetical protein [Haloparvum sedimenti]
MYETGTNERGESVLIGEIAENGHSRAVLFSAETDSVADILARSDASRTCQTYYDETYVFLALDDRASGPVTVIDLHDPDAPSLTDPEGTPLAEAIAGDPTTAVLFNERMFHGDMDTMIDHVKHLVLGSPSER